LEDGLIRCARAAGSFTTHAAPLQQSKNSIAFQKNVATAGQKTRTGFTFVEIPTNFFAKEITERSIDNERFNRSKKDSVGKIRELFVPQKSYSNFKKANRNADGAFRKWWSGLPYPNR
jgi:hypothetical protein